MRSRRHNRRDYGCLSGLKNCGANWLIPTYFLMKILIKSLFIELLSGGQKTAKRLDLSVLKSRCLLSTTHGGGFTLALFNLNVKQGSCEYQFL